MKATEATISRAFFDKRGYDGRRPWTVTVRTFVPKGQVWYLRAADESTAKKAIATLKRARTRAKTLGEFIVTVEFVQGNMTASERLAAEQRSRAAYQGINAPDGAIGDGHTAEVA
jgi:hypothetical protein